MSDVIGWVGAATSAVALATGYFGRPDPRRVLERDVDLIAKLPEGSARQRLSDHVEQRVRDLVQREQEFSRDWSGVVAAVFFLAVAFALLAGATSTAALWAQYVLTFLGVLIGLIGAFGLGESVQLKGRGKTTATPGE